LLKKSVAEERKYREDWV